MNKIWILHWVHDQATVPTKVIITKWESCVNWNVLSSCMQSHIWGKLSLCMKQKCELNQHKRQKWGKGGKFMLPLKNEPLPKKSHAMCSHFRAAIHVVDCFKNDSKHYRLCSLTLILALNIWQHTLISDMLVASTLCRGSCIGTTIEWEKH